MTARTKHRRKKKKRSPARKRQVTAVKKLSRRAPARPTRAHDGGRRRRQKLRTKDLLEEGEV